MNNFLLAFTKKYQLQTLKRIVHLQNQDIKEYFNKDGCGLEIEFGVVYEKRCISYIENGLKKLYAMIESCGKIVEDETIGMDLNLEIVLNPLDKKQLRDKFRAISAVLNHYENFVVDDNCGVHATFRLDDEHKRKLYYALIGGAYKSKMFVHSKYKPDLMSLVKKEDGRLMNYEEYLLYQQKVGHKYVAVNFLKENLVEFRSLDMNWEKINYVIELVEKVNTD